MERVFILDLGKCTGCQACRIACALENGPEPAAAWRTVLTFNEPNLPGMPRFHLSLACNHCRSAPCMEQCPARAFRRDEATGALVLDGGRCLGCRYCSWVCPFDAPRYDVRARVMSKCTLCLPRLSGGLLPACVSLCPTGALAYAEPPPGAAESVPGFPRTDFAPAIRFVPLRKGRCGPECSAAQPVDSGAAMPAAAPARASLKTEWPLAVFSLGSAVLAALVAAAAARGLRLDPAAFLVAGSANLLVGTLHLGRKLRAWRALLNLRRSRLSREVFLYLLFLALAALAAGAAPPGPAWRWAAAAAGAAMLYAVDRIYDPVAASRYLHSAGMLWTGVFLTGALLVDAALVGVVGGARLVLYVGRKAAFLRRGLPLRPLAAALRLGFPAMWLLLPPGVTWLPLACLLAGELVDRFEYYAELEPPAPRRRIDADLRALARPQGLT